MGDSYDVVVVGSGAAGGMAAWQLTRAGVRVLMLEAGVDKTSFADADGTSEASTDNPGLLTEVVEKVRVAKDVLQRSAMEIGTAVSGRPDLQKLIHLRAAEEGRPPDADRQMIQEQCPVYGPTTASLYVDDIDHPYMVPSSAPYVWIRGRQLGGRTQTWKRMTPRMTDHEFLAAQRDGLGECWPLTEEEMRPHYEEAERALRVTGSVEAGVPDYSGALSTRPMTGAERQLKRMVSRAWPDRQISLSPYASPFGAGESGDMDERWDRYDEGANPSYDCSVRSTIAEARATGQLTIRTNAIVHRVEWDRSSGRATGVLFLDARTKEEHRAEARAVVLAASSLESTRILLNSRCSEWPDGLANSSGVLGSYLTGHLFGVGAVGIKPRRGQRVCQPPVLVQSFRNRLDDHRDHGFLRGYQYAGYFGALRGGPFRTWMTTLILSAHGEVIPQLDNRVSIDESVVDAWGIPVLRIECRRGDNEANMSRDMLETGCEMLEAAGYEIMMRSADPLPPGASIHEGGTARMGSDPKTSVLNPYLCSWDVPNLYVTDAAAFTTAGNQNPALTIGALNVRACAHLVDRMKRREL